MNRLLTTLVQLSITIPALIMGRIVVREWIDEWQHIKSERSH
jgi:hypothetical protein